jgi:hypothetical protein
MKLDTYLNTANKMRAIIAYDISILRYSECVNLLEQGALVSLDTAGKRCIYVCCIYNSILYMYQVIQLCY